MLTWNMQNINILGLSLTKNHICFVKITNFHKIVWFCYHVHRPWPCPNFSQWIVWGLSLSECETRMSQLTFDRTSADMIWFYYSKTWFPIPNPTNSWLVCAAPFRADPRTVLLVERLPVSTSHFSLKRKHREKHLQGQKLQRESPCIVVLLLNIE